MRYPLLTAIAALIVCLPACGGGGGASSVDFSPIVGVLYCTVVASSGPPVYPYAPNDTFDATVTDDGHLHLGSYDVPLQPAAGGRYQSAPQAPYGAVWRLDPQGRTISSDIPGNQQAGLVLSYTIPPG